LSETRSAGTTGYVYDAADELTGSSGPGGSVVYGYDGRGEQTSAGAVGYGYDLAGRLTSATVAGTTTVYGYDGDGNRLSATAGASTVEYLWDTNNDLPELALERSGAGAPLLFASEGKHDQVLLALEAFSKKTQKTPPAKIKLAKRRLHEWRARGR